MSQWFAERCSCVIGFHKVASSGNFTSAQVVLLVDAALFLLFLPLSFLKDWAMHEKDIKIMKSICPSKICDAYPTDQNHRSQFPDYLKMLREFTGGNNSNNDNSPHLEVR